MLMQDLLMVPSTQVNAWEERFAVKLAFRKLSLLMTSVRCNVWWQHLKANGWLPDNCGVTELVLYDIDTIWHHIIDSELSSLYCARPLPSVSAFNKQAKKAIGDVTEEQKLHHIWYQYQGVLGRGFGLQKAGNLQQQHCRSGFDEHARQDRMPHKHYATLRFCSITIYDQTLLCCASSYQGCCCPDSKHYTLLALTE